MAESSSKNWSRYQKRVRTVIEFIHKNPAEDLSSDVLAEIAHLSPYHWHRIYKAITGESAMATVKRCRMHRAAAMLVRTDTPLSEVGASVGYPDIHSFNRTFKQFYGMAPGKFRASQLSPDEACETKKTMQLNERVVRVIEKPAATLIGLWHPGDYMTIGETFEQVMALCSMHGVMPDSPVMTGLYLADPDNTAVSELKSFAGIVVPGESQLPEPLERYIYPGGRFAVLTHQGPYAALSHGYDWLYSTWLPASDEAVRDQPCSEVYLNSPVNTSQQELLTDICMPIV